jgi:cytochrome c-type biogenesis protein
LHEAVVNPGKYFFFGYVVRARGNDEAAQEISLLIFSAGFHFSPCVPLVPSYITYITGVSFSELTGEKSKRKLRWITISHSLLFIIGFSSVFVLMGPPPYLGQVFSATSNWLVSGGILIMFLIICRIDQPAVLR